MTGKHAGYNAMLVPISQIEMVLSSYSASAMILPGKSGWKKKAEANMRYFELDNQGIPYCKCLKIKINLKKMSGPFLEDGKKLILLAEDDDDVREGIKEILEAEGYEVIEAIDGEDAVSKFMKKDDITKIRLLILDVGMPKKNGREVYDLIRKVSPEVKVLFTSGHESEVIERKGVTANGAHFIIKPFSPPVLLSKVHEILHRHPVF